MTTPKPVTTAEPKTHELKCLPGPFTAMRAGLKRSEFRRDDRDFQVGDTLRVREYDAVIKNGDVVARAGYTGNEDSYRVTYKLAGEFGVPHGYCVLGITPDVYKEIQGTTPKVTPIFYCLVEANGVPEWSENMICDSPTGLEADDETGQKVVACYAASVVDDLRAELGRAREALDWVRVECQARAQVARSSRDKNGAEVLDAIAAVIEKSTVGPTNFPGEG